MRSDGLYTGRDRQRCKACATTEGCGFDSLYAVRDGNGRKSCATNEGILTDAGNVCGNGDGCQTAAIIKGIITDFANITTKSIFRYLIAEYSSEVVAVCIYLGSNGIGVDGDGFKACALLESSNANAGNVCGNGDGCQSAAIIKGRITDGSQTGRKSNGC